jgi:hypothetical protein
MILISLFLLEMSSNRRNNLPAAGGAGAGAAAGGAGAAAGGAGAAAGASSGMTADRKIKEFQDYLTANGLTLDTKIEGAFIKLIIKKGDKEVALLIYTDYKEPPAKEFHDMEVFKTPTIYVHQVTRLDEAYKGIGKLLMQYVAALAAKQHKTFGFTAISDRGNTEKLVRYYNSIGANKVNKRFDKIPWGFTQRQLARRGVMYKTNDPLKIVSSGGGGKTRKRQHRKRKQTRRT